MVCCWARGKDTALQHESGAELMMETSMSLALRKPCFSLTSLTPAPSLNFRFDAARVMGAVVTVGVVGRPSTQDGRSIALGALAACCVAD
jgi:hypothetical protein